MRPCFHSYYENKASILLLFQVLVEADMEVRSEVVAVDMAAVEDGKEVSAGAATVAEADMVAAVVAAK
jgi:hypothetical protein